MAGEKDDFISTLAMLKQFFSCMFECVFKNEFALFYLVNNLLCSC